MNRKEYLQKVAESTHQNIAKKYREFRLEVENKKYPISDKDKKMISDVVSKEHQDDFAVKHPILSQMLLGIPEQIHMRRLSNALAKKSKYN